MVGDVAAAAVVGATLVVFVWAGLRAGRRGGDVEDYVVARNSQPATTLGLSFLAAGMGAWVLFAPPEVGAGVGMLGVAGYAAGAAAPFLVFALLGPRIRSVLPAGHSLPEFLRVRFGETFASYVGTISLLYMLFFVTAELTAIGAVAALLSSASPRAVIIAVAVATSVYTAIGGLRASLRTDRLQAWLIIGLLAAAAYAVLGMGGGEAGSLPTAALPAAPPAVGLQVAVTLVIAVTAANLFHQGYWQRVWAARDDAALRRGAVWGGLATMPVVAVLGYWGARAAGAGLPLGEPPAPFFAGVAGAAPWLILTVIVLGLALVASSVDTLQTGLASILVAQRRGLSLSVARLLTVALTVPAVVVALQGFSVLRLFLVADLLCAATVVPALSSLWRRATPAGALWGAVAGLLGAIGAGVVTTGALAGAALVTMPGAVPTLPPFAGALLASAAVTVAVSLAGRTTTDVAEVGARIPAWPSGRP